MEMRLVIKANAVFTNDFVGEWIDCSVHSLHDLIGMYEAFKSLGALDGYQIEYRTKEN